MNWSLKLRLDTSFCFFLNSYNRLLFKPVSLLHVLFTLGEPQTLKTHRDFLWWKTLKYENPQSEALVTWSSESLDSLNLHLHSENHKERIRTVQAVKTSLQTCCCGPGGNIIIIFILLLLLRGLCAPGSGRAQRPVQVSFMGLWGTWRTSSVVGYRPPGYRTNGPGSCWADTRVCFVRVSVVFRPDVIKSRRVIGATCWS